MVNHEHLEKMTDAQLAMLVQSHERDMQIFRNSRRVGIFITREISEGLADVARAILRRRMDDAKVTKIG
jgi:hypothetical protein